MQCLTTSLSKNCFENTHGESEIKLEHWQWRLIEMWPLVCSGFLPIFRNAVKMKKKLCRVGKFFVAILRSSYVQNLTKGSTIFPASVRCPEYGHSPTLSDQIWMKINQRQANVLEHNMPAGWTTQQKSLGMWEWNNFGSNMSFLLCTHICQLATSFGKKNIQCPFFGRDVMNWLRFCHGREERNTIWFQATSTSCKLFEIHKIRFVIFPVAKLSSLMRPSGNIDGWHLNKSWLFLVLF